MLVWTRGALAGLWLSGGGFGLMLVCLCVRAYFCVNGCVALCRRGEGRCSDRARECRHGARQAHLRDRQGTAHTHMEAHASHMERLSVVASLGR